MFPFAWFVACFTLLEMVFANSELFKACAISQTQTSRKQGTCGMFLYDEALSQEDHAFFPDLSKVSGAIGNATQTCILIGQGPRADSPDS